MTLFKGQRCDSIETLGINAAGTVAGICDSNGEKGFVRQPNGTMSLFKFQGSTDTDAIAIDDGGDVAGFYFPRHISATQGFVRDPDGTLHSYSFPSDFGSLGIDSIALVGGDRQTAGDAFLVSEKFWHGWIRHDNGTFELFRVDQGLSRTRGTVVAAMNPAGVIAGTYTNDDKVEHGFIRAP